MSNSTEASGSGGVVSFDPRALYTRHPTISKTLLIYLGVLVGMVISSWLSGAGIPRVVASFFGAVFWLMSAALVSVAIIFGVVVLRERIKM